MNSRSCACGATDIEGSVSVEDGDDDGQYEGHGGGELEHQDDSNVDEQLELLRNKMTATDRLLLVKDMPIAGSLSRYGGEASRSGRSEGGQGSRHLFRRQDRIR